MLEQSLKSQHTECFDSNDKIIADIAKATYVFYTNKNE